MAYFRTCEYCGGALDPGEKCDCRRQKNRNYTSIEGAGYAPKQIHPINYRNKKQTG
nr:MAG TPA: Rad50 zinc hook motif [Caudoviricetes sp.]